MTRRGRDPLPRRHLRRLPDARPRLARRAIRRVARRGGGRDLGLAVLGLMGPRARDALSQITDADLSQRRLPVRDVAEIDLGLRAGAGEPNHLCRRARLGALRPERVAGLAVRPGGGRRRAARPSSRRHGSRSTVCGPKRGSGTGARTWARPTGPTRPGSARPSRTANRWGFTGRAALLAGPPAGRSRRLGRHQAGRPRSAPARRRACASRRRARGPGDVGGVRTQRGRGRRARAARGPARRDRRAARRCSREGRGGGRGRRRRCRRRPSTTRRARACVCSRRLGRCAPPTVTSHCAGPLASR